IKVIDEQNAIGVMHLGTFPGGIDFATFVMARQNYPFENMSIPDHQALFADARATAPSPAGLEGHWDGRLIFLTTPDTSLLNQVSPVLFQVSFHTENAKTEAQCKAGPVEFAHVCDPAAIASEMRLLDGGTLLGKWTAPASDPAVSRSLAGFTQAAGQFTLYFVLKQVLAERQISGGR